MSIDWWLMISLIFLHAYLCSKNRYDVIKSRVSPPMHLSLIAALRVSSFERCFEVDQGPSSFRCTDVNLDNRQLSHWDLHALPTAESIWFLLNCLWSWRSSSEPTATIYMGLGSLIVPIHCHLGRHLTFRLPSSLSFILVLLNGVWVIESRWTRENVRNFCDFPQCKTRRWISLLVQDLSWVTLTYFRLSLKQLTWDGVVRWIYPGLGHVRGAFNASLWVIACVMPEYLASDLFTLQDIYYLAFPKDRVEYKTLVYGLYLLETTQTMLFTSSAFRTFATGFRDQASLDRVDTLWFSVPIMSGISKLIFFLNSVGWPFTNYH